MNNHYVYFIHCVSMETNSVVKETDTRNIYCNMVNGRTKYSIFTSFSAIFRSAV